MGKWKYYTPDGVTDILPDDCARKRAIESKLRSLFALNGYLEIETPALEFYDVYAAGKGFAPQEGMFKFFDKQGRILALRYDGTIPAARLVSTLLKDKKPPIRLSYIENMFRYNETGGGKQIEFTQAGIELMGPATPQADAQVITTSIEAAILLGITDLQVSLGDVEFFKGVMDEWKISEESSEVLLKLIDSKEMVALEDMCGQLKLNAKAKRALLNMASSYGTYDLIEEMRQLVTNKRSLHALDNLSEVLRILEEEDILKYVSLDLGMLQSLNYYTGIIFKGFTYGIGFPILSGGRYDNVVGEFGRTLSATGFSMGINLVMTALARQKKKQGAPETKILVGYDIKSRKNAFNYVKQQRKSNVIAELDCMNLDAEQLSSAAKNKGMTCAVFIGADGEIQMLE
ncbi:MAG: ATP phosphoribosyltransferase regulatory subunit [Saccharofermentanales bacterium]